MSNEDRLDRAEVALESGDFRAAIIDAKDVLRGEPENSRGRVLLGRASVAVGDGQSAEKELRRAIELGVAFEAVAVPLARSLLLQREFHEIVDDIQPDSVSSADAKTELRLIRGDAFMGLGQPAVARQLYNDVLTADAGQIGAYLGLASTYRAEGNVTETRRILDQVTSKFPDDVRGWLSYGDLHLGQQEFSEAGIAFNTAHQLAVVDENDGAAIQALAGLAETQFALQNVDEARATVARIVETAPDSIQALLLSARVAYLDEDWTAAQQSLQRVLMVVPNYPPAQTLLGSVHFRSGNLSQAEMYLTAVVVANPSDNHARRLLAETRIQMRDLQEAEATLAPLISSDEPSAVDLAMAARASLGQGDVDSAIELLQRGVEEDPSNVDLQFQLAIALMNAGREQEFSEVLAAIDVSSSPLDEFRRDMLHAMSLARTSGLATGLSAAQQLVETWPNNPNAHILLGSLLRANEDFDAARSAFEKVADLQPGDQTAQLNLAALDEQQGALDAARQRYEIALEANPGATWAMMGLARLAARKEDLGEAREWLQRIRRADENIVAPRVTLASLLISEQEFAEAEVVVDEALRINNEIPALHDLLGRARFGQDDHVGASMAFKRALELAPGNDQYRLRLAQAQKAAGDDSLAEQTLLDNGAVDLDNIQTAVAIASLRVDSGDFIGAMQIASALQERHADSPVPHALEAEIHVRADRLEDAATAYDRALAIGIMRSHALRAHRIKAQVGQADQLEPLKQWLEKEPGDGDVRMVLAESLQKANQIDSSIDEYQAVLQQDANNAIALNNLAWTYYLANDERAVDTARMAYSLLPEHGSVADTLGWILVETGDVNEGVDVLGRAVELSNGRAEVRYHYAVGLARSGDAERARNILQEILSTDESFSSREDAERMLADL